MPNVERAGFSEVVGNLLGWIADEANVQRILPISRIVDGQDLSNLPMLAPASETKERG